MNQYANRRPSGYSGWIAAFVLGCGAWMPNALAQPEEDVADDATEFSGEAPAHVPAKVSLEALAFPSQTNREFDVWASSAARTLTGLPSSGAAISIGGDATAQYRIDAGPWTRAKGTVKNGQALVLRVRTAASGGVSRKAEITIAGTAKTFIAKTYATLAKKSVTVKDFDSAGRARSFILERPAQGDTFALPLIIALHGDGATAASARSTMNFTKLYSDKNRFIVIYPQALEINGTAQFNKYADDQRGFSAPQSRDYDANAPDDVRFLSDIIDYTARTYGIDRQKVYVTGFSGGGFMAYHYSVAAPKRIAGVAPVAASLYGDFASGYLPDFFAKRFVRAPVFHVHGLDDTVVPPPSAPANNGNGNVEYPLGNFGFANCGKTAPTSKADGKASTRTYCAGANPVQWVGIRGLNHAWPLQKAGYDATSNIWRFFKARSRACTNAPLQVSGRDVLDACSQPIQFRGVNYAAYKSGYNPNERLMPEIAATGANAVRIVWWIDNPDPSARSTFTAARLDAAITAARDTGMVPILNIQDLTCNRRPLSDINNLVVPWATSAPFKAILLKHKNHLIFNLANEAGFVRFGGPGTLASRKTDLRNIYKNAVVALRKAKLTMPLMIDAPDCGQSLTELMEVAPAITAADPLAGIIYSAHAYWIGYAPDAASAGAKLRKALTTAANPPQPLGLPVILGEIASRQDTGGNQVCDLQLPYADYMKQALRYNIGWMIWAWHEDCNNRRMVNAPFSVDDLTPFGEDVAGNTDYGLIRSVPVTLPTVP